MNSLEITKYILTILISASGISGIVIYISKKILDKSLDIALEKYKNGLTKEIETHKSELNLKIEEFKTTMNRLAIEHQIRYSKLHEERANLIKNIYKELRLLEMAVIETISIFYNNRDSSMKDTGNIESNSINYFSEYISSMEDTGKKLTNFVNYFLDNEIFFNDKISNHVREICESLEGQQYYNKTMQPLDFLIRDVNPENTSVENYKKMKGYIILLEKELCSEFKEILGVVNKNVN